MNQKYEKIIVPVYDMEGIYSDKPEDLERLAKELLDTSNEYGIVVIKNHGISLESIEKFFKMGDEFFKLPMETKMKYERTLKPFHGYFDDLREIDGKSLSMCESYDIIHMDLKFPEEVTGFKEAADEVHKQFLSLSSRIFKLLDVAFDSGDFFQRSHSKKYVEDIAHSMKIIRYPEVKDEIPAGAIRLREHADFGIFTLLISRDGLQIQDPNGEWKTPEIPEGSIFLQYGQALNIYSNNILKAPKHRVVVTENEKKNPVPRRVLAFFHNLSNDTIIKPFDESHQDPLSNQGSNPPTTFEEFIAIRIKNMYY